MRPFICQLSMRAKSYALLVFAVFTGVAGLAEGVNPAQQPLGMHDPSRNITSQVAGQAQLLGAIAAMKTAEGEVAKKMAEARAIDAKARSEVATARINEASAKMFEAKVYWSMRDNWDREMLARRGTPENNRKKANKGYWELIKYNTDLVGRAVPEGRALNFLLQRMSSDLLAYHFNSVKPPVSEETLKALRLDDRMLHALQLKQAGQGNELRIFRADGTGALEGRWWPYYLRFDEIKDARRRFEEARDLAISQAERGYEVDIKQLQQLEGAFNEVSRAFSQRFSAGAAVKEGAGAFIQFRAAESFLRDLDRQIKRFQASGDVRGLRPQFYDPKEAGKNLVTLLTYMSRNGTEFAPAEAGDEEAYSQIFIMMRDLYMEVADNDPSIQPKTGAELVNERYGAPKPSPSPPPIAK
jgi:hypothetical protein